MKNQDIDYTQILKKKKTWDSVKQYVIIGLYHGLTQGLSDTTVLVKYD